MPYKLVECPTCKGYGEYWDASFEQSYPCETCGGKGSVYDIPIDSLVDFQVEPSSTSSVQKDDMC